MYYLPSKRGNRKQAEMRERPKLFSDFPAKNEIGPAFSVNMQWSYSVVVYFQSFPKTIRIFPNTSEFLGRFLKVAEVFWGVSKNPVLSSCTGSQEPIQKTQQCSTAKQRFVNKRVQWLFPLCTGTPGHNQKSFNLTIEVLSLSRSTY